MGSTIDGGDNNVTITVVAANYRIADSGVTPVAGTGCTDTGATVDCPLASVTVGVVVPLGGGDDAFSAAGVNQGDPFTITDTSGTSVTEVTGSDGDDSIAVGDNDDPLNGGAGNDRFAMAGNTGDASGDEITGGLGIDRVIYTLCGTGVTVTIDGANNDGGTCADGSAASDDVHTDVESITGSNVATDTLTGSCSANTISGDSGTTDGGAGAADTINGDPAACTPNGGDFLGGGEGNDSFNCDGTGATPGVDTVTYGAPFVDGAAPGISVTLDDAANDNDGFGNATENVQGDCERIIGNAQVDTINAAAADQGVQLFGRLGNDALTGSGFNDLLNGEGGTDTGNCGAGAADVAISIETPTNCEL